MVKAIIDINKDSNRILNIIKAEYDLKTKSDAIEKLAELYNKDKVVVATRKRPLDLTENFRKHYG
ncbi:DUF2683 family protein [Candidatus Woesearchaeota archaeon]|jgi:hypothetical protein|nr:DUF2683 family protein [Candidatus Woesearchaeota archaeon]MBT4114324.1 DUF2683 family protein [Candidatus Woesearchaeota archaeon]MBT4248468.1 DUF2683 family protein [Candidatus Woesearchaeota archaeon]